MAADRSKKSQRNKGSNGKSRGSRASSARAIAPERGSAGGDILGVTLVVAAVAMGASLLDTSQAPVTRAMGEFLTLCFGVGAFLVPVAIALFGITFFIRERELIAGRVAAGLALIVVSILGLISMGTPLASSNPSLVLASANVVTRGGYLGGFIAWMLLNLTGEVVGDVVLVGLMVVGVIVAGFSVSNAVQRAGSALEARRESKAAVLPEDEPYDEGLASLSASPDLGETVVAPAEAPTTFLGARKTSVLKRGRHKAEASQAQPDGKLPATDGDGEGTQKTRLLRRRRHPDIDVETALPASDGTVPEQATIPLGDVAAGDSQAGEDLAVPEFLRAAAEGPDKSGSRRSRRGTARGAGSATAAVTAGTSKETASVTRAKAAPGARRPGEGDETYELPPLSMLSSNPKSAKAASSAAELQETMQRLQATLQEFGLKSRVVDYVSGPLVTTFRIEMGEGERVNKITNLEDDIALTLATPSVRIFAPIPGTSLVGIEIPNKKRENVHLGDVLPYAKGGPLELAIGRDSEGEPVVADLAKMPHLLIAGATGSGKSVMINSIIMSLLMRCTPKQVRLIMIDPKRVELGGYNGLPHLYVPVVTEPRQAASALQWAVSEMERRLKVFERAGAREIKAYNQMCVSGKLSEMDNPPEPMPYLVVIIDELSDLMMVAGKDVEASIVRIAQLARAAGIHLIVATQRPSADVVTGLIKSNIENRIAFSVASGTDSRVIIDQTGAERLLGSGDMLFKFRGRKTRRILGCYVSDPEIESVVDFIRDQAEPDYHEEILSQVVPGQTGGSGSSDDGDEYDPLVWEAAQIVVDSQLGSTSGLQRRLKVGYARAGRIMDMLEAKGVVGPPEGSKPREVLLDKEGLEELRVQDEKYREV